MVCGVLKRGPVPYGGASGKQEEEGGGRLEETGALVGLLPPGGILNWNAQNNHSHSHQTDVGRRPTG